MSNNIKLIIFDCDGVLIDSEILSMKAWQAVLSRRHRTLSAAYFTQHFLGKSMQHVLQCLADDFSLAFTAADVDEFHHELQQQFRRDLHPTPGIETVLSHLQIPYCLATSSSPQRTRFALKTSGLAHYFGNNRFTRDEVEHGKPAPDLFLHAANTMQVAPAHCLVIEDSEAGLQAARAANMPYLHYIGGTHLKACTVNGRDTFDNWNTFRRRFAPLFKNGPQ
ncbi:HAD family hydrolase [Salinimonas marina]|uniref:HAD family hydrolase n=1 Tax=Salinimonas marina TaxID=2785918 RepID=UPI001E625822|nr:HAD family hydrolase [Salinimonas marina]